MYFVNDQIEETLNVKNRRMSLMTKISVALILIGFIVLMILVNQLANQNSFLNTTWTPNNVLYLFYSLFSFWSNIFFI